MTFDPRAIVSWACALAITSTGAIASVDPSALAQALIWLPVLLAAMPYTVVAGAMATRARHIAALLALVYCAGVAALAVLALALAGNDVVGLLVMLAEVSGVAMLAFVHAHIGLACGALGIVRKRNSGYGLLGQTLIVGVLATSCLVALHAGNYLASPHRVVAQGLARGLDARIALLRLNRCLAEHHASHGEYPRTLAAIGPSGSRCAEHALVEDGLDGYRLSYDTVADGYVLYLRATGDSSSTADDRRSDATGTVYHSLNADGSGGSGTADPLTMIGQISRCAQEYRRHDATGRYARDLATVQAERGCFSRYGVDHEQGRAVVELGRLDGFTYVYRVPATATAVDRFTLELRPLRYGRPHTRSYTCTDAGVLYWTDEDRAAAAGDPDYQQDPVTLEQRRDYCVAP